MKKKDPTQEAPARAAEHDTPSKSGMTRRQFLDTTLAATSVLAFPALIASACGTTRTASDTAGTTTGPLLTQPKVIRSDGNAINTAHVIKLKS